jgi:hypothetical protein
MSGEAALLHDITGTLSNLGLDLEGLANMDQAVRMNETEDPIHGDHTTPCTGNTYFMSDPHSEGRLGARLTIVQHDPDVHRSKQWTLGGCAVMFFTSSNAPVHDQSPTRITTAHEDLWAKPDDGDMLWLRKSGTTEGDLVLPSFERYAVIGEADVAAQAIVQHFIDECQRLKDLAPTVIS